VKVVEHLENILTCKYVHGLFWYSIFAYSKLCSFCI